MTQSRFSNLQIDAVSDNYKVQYKIIVLKAIQEYITWMDANTSGIRFFTRFTHIYHGADGRARAEHLRSMLNSAKTFCEAVDAVGNVLDECESGYNKHSLRMFIHHNMTNKEYASPDAFVSGSRVAIQAELTNVKFLHNSNIGDNLSFWCLTNLAMRRNKLPAEKNKLHMNMNDYLLLMYNYKPGYMNEAHTDPGHADHGHSHHGHSHGGGHGHSH